MDPIKRLFLLGLLALVTAWGCERESRPPAAAPLAHHNLLLITLDTTRADRLGCYGYAEARTPVLDALAARGTRFSRAYAQVPITLPSHGSLLTGRYPRELGVRNNGATALHPDVPTLATLFRAHGYRTGAFIASFVLDSQFGLDHGFDTYDDEWTPQRSTTAVVPGQENALLAVEERGADAVTDAALAWLGAPADEPFFCWIHYYDPHDPYEPPAEYADAPTPYDGEIAFMDAQIGRVLTWLEGAGLRENTLVIAVGDHGEAFGEHGEHGHTIFLYNQNLHVPLICAHPQVVSAGRTIEGLVGIVDVFPTVLELFGWERQGELLSESFASALRGEAYGAREVYAESLFVYEDFGWAEQRALITSEWKYVSSTQPELFDRLADPAEQHNLVMEQPEVAAELLASLRGWFEAMEPGQASTVALDQSERARLESLGYVAGAESAPDEEQFLTPGLPDPKAMSDVAAQVREARRQLQRGEPQRAVRLLVSALDHNPALTAARIELSAALRETGDLEGAVEQAREALRQQPESSEAQRVLGLALLAQGQAAEAEQYLSQAARETPASGMSLINRGISLAKQGRHNEARELFVQALEFAETAAEAHYNLGVTLANLGQPERAVEHYEEALRINPAYARPAEVLGGIYLGQGRVADGARVLELGARHNPDNLRLVNSLAWLRATTTVRAERDGARALKLAQRVAELTRHQHPAILRTLAAAQAATGDFAAAIETATRALELAEAAHQVDLKRALEAHLEQYRASKSLQIPPVGS